MLQCQTGHQTSSKLIFPKQLNSVCDTLLSAKSSQMMLQGLQMLMELYSSEVLSVSGNWWTMNIEVQSFRLLRKVCVMCKELVLWHMTSFGERERESVCVSFEATLQRYVTSDILSFCLPL